MMLHLRRFWILVLGLTLAAVAAAEPPRTDLEAGFAAPPVAAKPWAYWWWVKGNVDEATITRDLEQMRAQGFAGLLLFDARGYHEDHLPPPPTKMEFMSPPWRQMVRRTVEEAGRLGLEVSVNLSSCAGALRGPWLVGDDAPKKLVWATVDVPGGAPFTGELPGETWERSRDIATLAVRRDGTGGAVATEVVDLSTQVRDGRLTWSAPPGRWTVLRFAYVLMEDREYDVDILDPQAVSGHFDRMGGALLADVGPLAGKTLTHFYSVSWEGAAPTWTRAFEEHFERYRGYKPTKWLPVLAGIPVQSQELSDRFLRDYHKTLGDCFMNHCYGTLRERCHKVGLQWHSESGGPWDRKIASFSHADQLAFLGRNDMPQGEFWYPERGFNRPVAMAAHVYGRPLAAAEAFAHMVHHWSVYPAILKPCADMAFCDGINHLIWHTFTASPAEFGKPGIEYFAGTHINSNVTWFEQSGAFLEYLARCQWMLRQGLPVVDVCVYTGDRTYLHWGRAEQWSGKPSLALPAGYSYDLINTEALVERASVDKGRIVLPDGMSYAMLVVDLEADVAPPAALHKIAELVRDGATVVYGAQRPARAPGLTDYPACDDEVRRLADELWGPASASAEPASLEASLKDRSLPPDCTGPWRYTHRRGDATDIYFVSGTGQADLRFRVASKEPEIWDPVSGQCRRAPLWRSTEDGRTEVTLTLPENGSAFVVFRREAGAAGPSVQRQTQPATTPSRTLDGPWKVAFAPGWGAPAEVVFERLTAWNDHPGTGIRHFSGSAVYRTKFTVDDAAVRAPVWLDLGDVRHVARVRLNGKSLGTVWTAPWRVDLSSAVRAGENELEIEVTNVWANRLIGDAALPEAERLTKTHARRPPGEAGRHAHLKGYKADDPLIPSGLLGPVRLEFGGR